jgi:RimJ/RimL family protein N-acetyltransferase
VERSDLPKFLEWLNDPEVLAGLSQYLPLSSLDEERWFDRVNEGELEQRPLGIELEQDGQWRLIGNAGLFNLEWTNRQAEFGIFIGDKTCWNQGYGTEALQLILQHAFDTLNLNRVYLRVYATNPRARRSYEKAGFVPEGTLRESVFRQGKYIDTHVMSILRSEWIARKEGA